MGGHYKLNDNLRSYFLWPKALENRNVSVEICHIFGQVIPNFLLMIYHNMTNLNKKKFVYQVLDESDYPASNQHTPHIYILLGKKLIN